MLRIQEWNVINTHGNKFQGGFPDLYCFHHKYGERWVEVKRPGKETFTEYQNFYFPKIRNVWLLRGTTREEYLRLFQNPNYLNYLGGNAKPKPHEVQSHYEGQIQIEVTKELEAKGYTVMPTYGNNIQKGLPDLYLLKRTKRQWLELKRELSFTPAQVENFPRMLGCKIPIWLLDVSGGTYDLSILDREANLKEYML
jgi:hypothetical protein